MGKLEKKISGKKVLFITTKNIDYIRNVQEIKILKENAKNVDILYSSQKNNILRIVSVLFQVYTKKINDIDVIFLGFEPQFILPFVRKKFKDKEVIIDFFISVYDTLVCDRKKISSKGIGAQFCRWLDEITLKNAAVIVTDTKTHAQFFIEEFNGEASKFETIYLEADRNIFYPRKQIKPKYLQNKYIVLYFGSILPLQGVEVILDAVRKMNGREDILFDIIGPIPKKYDKPIQDNVRYTKWLTQQDLAERIAQADICLAGHFSANIDKAKRTIAGKTYIYEAMQKKMILGDTPANHELFSEDEKHQFVITGSADSLVEKLLINMSEEYT